MSYNNGRNSIIKNFYTLKWAGKPENRKKVI